MANATITVLEADGTTQTDVVVLDVGRQAAAASKSVAASTEDKAVLDSLATKLDTIETSVDAVTSAITGSVADGDADSGNSSKVAGIAKTNLSGETLHTAGDRSPVKTDTSGALFVRNVPLTDVASGGASNTDGTSTAMIAASGDAAIKTYLTHVSLSNAHASTVAIVEIKSGSTVRWTVAVPPGGREIKFDPPLAPNAANEAWNYDPGAAVTTLYGWANGYKSKV